MKQEALDADNLVKEASTKINEKEEKLKNDFDILSVQRNLKILGILGFLWWFWAKFSLLSYSSGREGPPAVMIQKCKLYAWLGR